MHDPTTTVDTYIAMWNETDAAARAEIIARAWAADGRYADPAYEASGHRGLNELVSGVQEHFPGHRISRTTAVDAHHDQVRFGWQLTGPDGAVAVAGIDAGELDAEGRLTRIIGYFGDLVPEAAPVATTAA